MDAQSPADKSAAPRAGEPLAVAFHQTFESLDSGWVSFPWDYLLYASEGAFQVEVGHVRWFLPPQRAAFIAAGTPMRGFTSRRATSASVLFAKGAITIPHGPCCVFAVSVLAREMIQFAMRWGRDRDPNDAVADRFFLSLAAVCEALAAQPGPFWLPQAQSPELGRAMDYALARLHQEPTLAEAAAVASVSERTLARRFEQETTMTWQHYLRRARMIRAMELLTAQDIKAIEVAHQVGFNSQSAFIKAFRDFTGDTPSRYRARFHGAA